MKIGLRLIKRKERKLAGNIYCDHCKPAKVDAVYRKRNSASHQFGDYACEAHVNLIEIPAEDQNYTEADYQTWLRL